MSTLRIAITGLKGAGKTVFLTSLINNLIRGTADSFPAFKKRGVLFNAEPAPLAIARRRFPFNEYMRQYREEAARWPASTVDVSEFHLTLELKRKRARSFNLQLLDYPGERLLDMPLLGKSYEQWSDEVCEESKEPVRRELAEPWTRACEAVAEHAGSAQEAAKGAVAAYRDYLLACRGRGLQYLQPSAFVLDTEDAAFLDLAFCPLPRDIRTTRPAVAAAFAKRYGAYREGYVRPFVAEAVRSSRQIVLVDVLRVLRSGLHCFRDTQRCLEEILKVFSYSPSYPTYAAWWQNVRSLLSLNRRIEHVAFVATKADLATRPNRTRLRHLLEVLVRFASNRLRFRLSDDRIAYDYCAAFRCTEDAAKRLDDMPLSVLKGRRQMSDGEARDGVWFPGEVPEEWPEEAYDPMEAGFMFPVFMPRPLPRDRDDLPIEHLNLDELFYSMVEGYIR